MIIGYTTGVFDLFHIGHVNLLKNAKAMCDKLIVGVSLDDLVSYKGKKPIIPYHERVQVVRSCRYVDVAIPQANMNKVDAVMALKANYLFVGGDWFKSEKWNQYEADLKKIDCTVIYFPYTEGTSSTIINNTIMAYK